MDTSLQSAQTTAQNAQVNPFVTARVNAAGQQLNDIDAGKFGSLPLVQAVSQAANRAHSWNPPPQGDAALAAGAAGQGGYATQENELRKRMQDNTIANIMPQAVEAERSNAQNVLFPGSQMLSAFDLAKAGALNNVAGQASNIYGQSGNMGFFNKFGNEFFSALGHTLGTPTASWGGGSAPTGGFN